jgi:glycosyltransferase involved in cell wall biosynthesis
MKNNIPIRVFIQTDKFEGGPAVFRSRLISALSRFKDIKVVTDINDRFDIELAFIRKVYNHNKPYILRVDGCYYEKQRKKSNIPLEDAILRAEYVIFQSYFSLKLCKHVLRINHKIKKEGLDYSVIHNGIDVNYINKIKPSQDIKPGSFISCAGWRPNKRPISTIEGFLKANTERHLYLVGGAGFVGKEINNKYNSKYIHILGEKSNKKTISIMKACDYQIHLCHIDSCPNSVIEGLSCGLNVLCTNLGGTSELVGNNGVILNVDKFWEKRYLKIKDFDTVSSSVVSDGVKKLINTSKKVDFSGFDIGNVSLKYKEIIRKVFNA